MDIVRWTTTIEWRCRQAELADAEPRRFPDVRREGFFVAIELTR